MDRKKILFVALACCLALPVAADPLSEVGAVFIIESPEVFPDPVLGESKEAIEQELSTHLAERLKFYFPFFDWTATSDEAQFANGLIFKLLDEENELCDWQSILVVRAVRAGNTAAMVNVPDKFLYDLCDAFIPNRKDPNRDALLPEDAEALVSKLKRFVEDVTGEFDGLLNNTTVRKAIHDDLLSTIPLARNFEIREQSNGSKLLYLPVNFDELKASSDEQCEGDSSKCSLVKLTLEVPGSPPGSLSLRIAGSCNDLVLCEVLSGSVPGRFQVARPTYWDADLGDLLAEAQNLKFTMKEFTKSPFACAFDEP